MSAGSPNIDTRAVARALLRLPDDLKKAAERAVLTAGAKPITKSAKAHAPTSIVHENHEPGLLKKSIGQKVKKRNGEYSARIGARTGFAKVVGTAIARKTKGKKVKGQPYAVIQDPNKYSHLVEYGTSHSPAKPFIRPAVDQAEGQVVSAMAAGLDKYLSRVVSRLRGR